MSKLKRNVLCTKLCGSKLHSIIGARRGGGKSRRSLPWKIKTNVFALWGPFPYFFSLREPFCYVFLLLGAFFILFLHVGGPFGLAPPLRNFLRVSKHSIALFGRNSDMFLLFITEMSEKLV